MNRLHKFSNSPSKLILFFIKNKPGHIISLLIITLIIGTTPALDGILVKLFLDKISSFNTNTVVELPGVIIWWIVLYFIYYEIWNIIWRLYDYVFFKTWPVLKGIVVEFFFNYIIDHSHSFFQINLTGDIVNRITEASRSLEMIYSIFIELLLRKGVALIASIFALYYVNPILALIFIIWLVVFCSISMAFSKKIKDYSNTYSRNKAILSGKLVDTISNIFNIRMFCRQNYEKKYLKNVINSVVESDIKMQWFMFKLRYILSLSCSIVIISMLYYASFKYSKTLLTIGDFALIITICSEVSNNILDTGQNFGDFFEQYGAFSQSLSLLFKHDISNNINAKQLEVTNGTIEFKQVNFSYKDISGNLHIFKNKNIKILGKQKIGLVGHSGSGKSTFVSVICRLHDLDQGQILIDNQNIALVTQKSLHENISIIPQESILFHRSIKENIQYGKLNATDDEIYQAAQKAHIHTSILSLPKGYDTICGERGNILSGGQKQRIIIARAILKNAPILILDEATSSLDSITEKLIQESLHYLMENKTVLIIAHRLSTLVNTDRILVFDNGSIVEDGNHKNLLVPESLYYKYWNSQMQIF